ncbi:MULTISPECIES: LytTR family DNA-binding domain-containing protein [Cryobacterium]|uniref:Response regulator transcription factor n=1 Tax=Cryobacterium mannosilyticum TaxID=1259190 RepID=A0A4R8WH06_9MICO|nr:MULTISPECIES: LytTR family DNA-binding domain-containing protein [Cryobacterium]TFB94292.1 response regulator transcription factor [Cryobacterium sp. HLT2-28]TFC06435.1 response regulator transcription factor [Cryobacterium mannosilyticum]
MISVLIADDELPALDELAFLLGRDERVGTIHRASSGSEALRILDHERVDALFLDIHMPGLSGLDIAHAVSRSAGSPAVVFVTADEDHAVKAFELAAVDYLLKPVRAERLAKSVARVIETLAMAETTPPTLITVDLGGLKKMIRRDEVRYVQAQGDYARLHTDESSYLIRVPLADLEKQWADAGFLRIHRSYLVSMSHITQAKLGAARPTIVTNGAELPVSRRHLPDLREKLEATRIRPSS